MRFWRAGIYLAFLGLLLSPKPIFAQVIINEFMPDPDSGNEWVEFYNSSDGEVDLSDYYFDDDNNFDDDSGSSSKIQLTGKLSASGLCYLELSTYLNNGGDSPTIMRLDTSVVDAYSYSSSTKGKTYSRIPDGGSWEADQNPSKASIACVDLSPTKTPDPSPTSTENKIQSASCVIAKPKDSEANEINNVKIYIDGNYTGNYAEETYEFCGGCTCGSNDVPCELGNHTVSLERLGYDSWSQSINIISGDSLNLNPVMSSASTTSIQSTPTPTSTITSVRKTAESNYLVDLENPNVDRDPIDMDPLVLGEKTEDVDITNSLQQGDKETIKEGGFPIGPVLFITGGMVFLGAASIPFLKDKSIVQALKAGSKKVYNPKGEEET